MVIACSSIGSGRAAGPRPGSTSTLGIETLAPVPVSGSGSGTIRRAGPSSRRATAGSSPTRTGPRRSTPSQRSRGAAGSRSCTGHATASTIRPRSSPTRSTNGSESLPEGQPGSLAPSGRGDESVPEAPLRLDVAGRVGRVPELVPEPANVHADVVDLVDVLATPDLGQKRAVF